MDDSALFDRTFVLIASSRVRMRAEPSAPIVCAVHAGDALPGHMVRGLAYRGQNQWARVKLPSGVVGYVWSGYGLWQEAVEV